MVGSVRFEKSEYSFCFQNFTNDDRGFWHMGASYKGIEWSKYEIFIWFFSFITGNFFYVNYH